MFEFSSRVTVNKEFKVSDVLKTMHASKEVRADASKIDSMRLAYVINAARINCQENPDYREIYIFEINLNSKDLPTLFVEALDKTIKFHTFFVFKLDDYVATTMCFKRIDKTVRLEKYHPRPFALDKPIPLPDIQDVPEAYKFLYSYEMDIPYRKSESPEELFQRIATIRKIRYDIEKLEEAIIRQLQPKKKYEYHQKVAELKNHLTDLLKEEE